MQVQGFSLSREVEDLLIADGALTLGFAFVLQSGAFGASDIPFPILLLISFVATTPAFVLHELMHKYAAERLGAVAAFRRSDQGIIITLVTSFVFRWLMGVPGATVYYAPNFTRKEEGIVSLAGPVTNFFVFAFFFIIGSFLFPDFLHNMFSGSYLQRMLGIASFFSLYLAFFNMLPLYPFDGSKIMRMNKLFYLTMMLFIFELLYIITGFALVPILLVVFVMAFILSSYLRMTAF